MRCEESHDRLLELVYGELSPRDQGALEAHLAVCEACRTEHAQLLELRQVMALLPEEDPARGDEFVLQAAAREARARAVTRPAMRLGRWLVRRPVVIAGATAGLVIFMVVRMVGPEAPPGALTPSVTEVQAAPPARDKSAAEGRVDLAREPSQDRAEEASPPPQPEPSPVAQEPLATPAPKPEAAAPRRSRQAPARVPPQAESKQEARKSVEAFAERSKDARAQEGDSPAPKPPSVAGQAREKKADEPPAAKPKGMAPAEPAREAEDLDDVVAGGGGDAARGSLGVGTASATAGWNQDGSSGDERGPLEAESGYGRRAPAAPEPAPPQAVAKSSRAPASRPRQDAPRGQAASLEGAAALAAAGDCAQALGLLDEVLRSAAGAARAEAYYRRCECLRRLDRVAEAQNDCALAVSSGAPSPWTERARRSLSEMRQVDAEAREAAATDDP